MLLAFILAKWAFIFGTVGCFIVIPFFYSFSFDRTEKIGSVKSNTLIAVSICAAIYGVSLKSSFLEDRAEATMFVKTLTVDSNHEFN